MKTDCSEYVAKNAIVLFTTVNCIDHTWIH